ncbi:hypothetical protein CTM50_11185 [Prevotella intermedia]|uniref:Uncharacterized protein n=1 Tax=Prevotella intermedia TaxID=28131 RepID=A0A2D3NFR9_PREIN|nr:hypothetical protein CTM50_11185 [Prevotella intermedia]
MRSKSGSFARQKRRFCIAKQPLLQCQIEITVFLMNYLYRMEVILNTFLATARPKAKRFYTFCAEALL